MSISITTMQTNQPHADATCNVDALRAALLHARAENRTLVDAVNHANGAVRFLMSVLAPIVAAHHREDHEEVKRLLDSQIEAGAIEVTKVHSTTTH